MSNRFILLALMVVASAREADAQNSTWGHFEGSVQAEWLPDGRKMKLLADFTYIDGKGFRWKASMGSEVDGASIPQVFWSFIGGAVRG